MFKKTMTSLVAATSLVFATVAHAGESINLYNWSDYIPPDLLKKFEKETGIKVNLDVFDSNESLLAKLKAGAAGYDVVVPSDYMVKVMIDEKLLMKIDATKMSNWKGVQPMLQTPVFDAKREYSVPYMWGTTGFTYDSARVPGGKLPDSWKSFFEPIPELKGQVVALNDMNDVYVAASLYLGTDQCTEDSKVGQRILDTLMKQKASLAMYNSDGVIERMQAKEVIMHQQWNGNAYRVKEKLKTAVYVVPKEGIPFWMDNLVIPAGAKNAEGAKKFVNWMMAPENIALASNFTGYNNGIKGADKFMDKALSADPAVNPSEEMKKRFVMNKICSTKAIELRNKVWTKLKS